MGFMDKAKRLAEQAQQRLDEAQTQFNQSQDARAGASGGGAVQYDQHGRPVAHDPGPPAAPVPDAPPAPETPDRPHGDPLAPEVPTSPPAAPPARPTDAPAAAPGAQGAPEDRNTVDYTPPAMTSGDPLAR